MPKLQKPEHPSIAAARIQTEGTKHGSNRVLMGTVVTVLGGIIVAAIGVVLTRDPAPAPDSVPPPVSTSMTPGTASEEPKPEPANVIHIRTATYGYAPSKWCKQSDLETDLRSKCDGLKACPQFTVNNDLCRGGDPAPYERKRLLISWDCSQKGEVPEGQPEASGLDGEPIALACKQPS